MLIPGRKDLFEFEFPTSFIPDELLNKYATYLQKMPSVIDDAFNYLNHSIQAITVPSISHEPVVQNQNGQDKAYRSSLNKQNLFSKELSITFQVTEGLINYFLMYDIFLYHYAKSNKTLHLDPFRLYYPDSEGIRISSMLFSGITFTAISEIELSFNENHQEFFQFTADFVFNKIDIELLDTSNLHSDNSLNSAMSHNNIIVNINDTIGENSVILDLSTSINSIKKQITNETIKWKFIINNTEISHFGTVGEVIDENFISVLSNNNITVNPLSTYSVFDITAYGQDFNIEVTLDDAVGTKSKIISVFK